MTKEISQEFVNEIFQGAIDCHQHTGPSLFARTCDSIESALEAKEAGMRAICFKNHQGITSDRATLVAKATGMECYGGICMNRYSGGINPYSVEAAMRMGGKYIWFPTQWAQHHIDTYGRPEYFHMKIQIQYGKENATTKGIYILKEDGTLTDETMEVLTLAKEHNAAIASGHLSKNEIVTLFKKAHDMGLDKLVLQHVQLNELWTWSPTEQKELVDLGVLIEHVSLYIYEGRYLISPKENLDLINVVGPENVVFGSDCGQLKVPTPTSGLKGYVKALLEAGASVESINIMLKKNPARILGLD
ncbi:MULTISPECIES: DUF6282 family protein [Aminobacterium]|jgi:hypothetical protein|uniref:Amidohydrolase 2 n=1 Tax=Aminobacterium colombiense (strain DSM 12261 / ALA-1) TaxID=572547 RepID=D5EDL4_AMICL|nr:MULTISPECIES: DUF6282 family protein [Aminobacterium]ADE56646.1 hypothetical protein Amico_0508 [Aminobacterium colombiense DSM 12261]NLK31231.1 hypothetical protein [Aminobacterium colombiense]